MMLSYCGLDGVGYPAYLVYRNDDQDLRERTAPEWPLMYATEFKPADIDCVGGT